MSARIAKVTVHIVEIPLLDEWKIALYAARTRRHALVEIETDDGVRGYGEASPSPAFMGETADTVQLVIERYLAPAIIGQPVHALAAIHAAMNAALYGNSAAKSAVDIAVHDAWGHTMQVPLHELIGGACRTSVPLTYVVGIKDNNAAREEAAKRIGEGFPAIKVKIGIEPARDIALVGLIREAIRESGRDVGLRLDCNQGYDVATAVRVIRELEDSGPLESVEQPVRRHDLSGIRDIRDKVRTPIMLDETIFGPEDAVQAIRLGLADRMNLKIAKVGGIFQAKKIAGMAEAAGITCTVGSNLELGPGIAASLHFAASTPAVIHPSDFICGTYVHERDLVTTPLADLVQDGALRLPSGPGLGITIDTRLLGGE